MIDSRGVEYDFGSLMHYSKFQGNNRPGVETIKPKDPSVDIGQRKGPSKLDIEQARLMYKCGKLIHSGMKYNAIQYMQFKKQSTHFL